MLFDLQGKRRRVVQATYLTLAVLMGGGLVLFGIGGEVQGGLADVFSSGNGDSGSGNDIIEERVKKNEERVKANPKDEAARKDLARDYYSLAAALPVGQDGKVPEEGQDELRKADAHYRAYLALEPEKPDASLALTALQIYDPNALNKPPEAKEAAALRARVKNDTESYLTLVQYATLAGDARTADLAAQKAVDLAPKKQRKAVKAAAQQAKAPAATGGVAGAAPAPATP
jgi:hypothetical protein